MSICILLIDDEPDFLDLLENYLSKEGHKVIAFSDPLQGLDYFKSNWYENLLIITDWRMPNMDGLVFANQIRQLNINVKILMLTA
ncbi:MAG: response regulator [Candidatus Nitrosocosmicus sp.]|nr:response regulator [Candidatus Nitrosocosmicus sp.]